MEQGRDPPIDCPGLDADVIVVGAGPSGMAAATKLAEAGCSVIVLDMQSAPGGQIYRGLEANVEDERETHKLLAALGGSYREGLALIRKFRAARSIRYCGLTTVWEVRPNGTVGWLRGNDAGYLRARHVLLAHGAMERPTPFPGWTLPGVMSAGAMQTLLKTGRMKPAGRVVLAGTGPLIFLLAVQLQRLGVKPVLIARTDRLADDVAAAKHLRLGAAAAVIKGIIWLARLRLARVRMASGVSRLEASGKDTVESVRYVAGGRTFTQACDLLIVHDGIVPSIDLSVSAGLALEWDGSNAGWRPRTSPDGLATATNSDGVPDQPSSIRVTGDARQIAGAEAAIAHGRIAARAILADLKRTVVDRGDADAAMRRAVAARPFLDAAFPPGLSTLPIDDGTIVCRCEELNAGQLRESIRGGAADINLLRAETRCGMGPCQGRNCMVTAASLIADLGTDLNYSHPFRGRPPARPLPLGALAHLSGLDPRAAQLMTLDDKPGTGETHAPAS